MISRIDPNPRMSRALIHQGIAYLSGQVPGDTDGDITAQTESMLQRVEQLLLEAGSDKSRMLSATIYLRHAEDFAAMNAVWDAWTVPGQAPTRTCVVAALPRQELLVEVTVTAAVDQ